MPALGSQLLQTIQSIPAGVSAAAFLRHAERHPILDATDPTLAELTEAGIAAAEVFGGKIVGFDRVRLFHSPVKRCRQTAEAIARGAKKTGCAVEVVGPEDALGVDYILDLKEAGRLTVLHGEHFVRLWFGGQVAPTVIREAAQIAARKLAFMSQRLHEPAVGGRRLDLHVSHDWNIIILRELLCGVRHEDAGWLNFLDGVAFYPTADGLCATYRERAVTRALPWRFERVDGAQRS